MRGTHARELEFNKKGHLKQFSDFQTAYPTEKPCYFESHGNVNHESDELPALRAHCSRNHPVFRAALCATGLTNG
ncbi:hypothetical protein [Neisseria sp. HMSC31F04]|uniref:hypothetical protein n=1 Tax=Neisseria sp. HMSC31F04 TaxID=1581075 RepID=UPI000AC8E844|nr:hypothetical protein [Neisseria sp. HMSC31F04]